MTFEDVSNILQNFTFMGAAVFEIAEGDPADPPSFAIRCGYQKAW